MTPLLIASDMISNNLGLHFGQSTIVDFSFLVLSCEISLKSLTSLVASCQHHILVESILVVAVSVRSAQSALFQSFLIYVFRRNATIDKIPVFLLRMEAKWDMLALPQVLCDWDESVRIILFSLCMIFVGKVEQKNTLRAVPKWVSWLPLCREGIFGILLCTLRQSNKNKLYTADDLSDSLILRQSEQKRYTLIPTCTTL